MNKYIKISDILSKEARKLYDETGDIDYAIKTVIQKNLLIKEDGNIQYNGKLVPDLQIINKN